MKHLKSTYGDLHRIFTNSITVREIAEPLMSFECTQPTEAVREFMDNHDYDVVGVRDRGSLFGYARRERLRSGVLGDAAVTFRAEELADESEPLLSALKALQHGHWLFVRFLGEPGGIVTRGDLQKAPIRMWLFGLITLLEMQMLRCIRAVHPHDSWKDFLKPEALENADTLLRRRQQRNDAIDLADCLMLEDKGTIFANSKPLLKLVAPLNKPGWRYFMRGLKNLRNDLAHASDIDPATWPKLAETVEEIERLLQRLEDARR